VTSVLVLAAGRRRYVLEELLASAPSGARLLAADADPLAVALTLPHVEVHIEPADTRHWPEWLAQVCRDRSVDAVLSLHDFQALNLAPLEKRLAQLGTAVIGPDAATVNTLIDKVAMSAHIEKACPGAAVETHLLGDLTQMQFSGRTRWIVKDRFGSGSSGLRTVTSWAEFQAAQQEASTVGADWVVQPACSGQEWNVDMFFDQRLRAMGHCAKRKIRMRAGETDCAHIVKDAPERLLAVCHAAMRGLTVRGNVDIDAFVDGDVVKVIDINPRFGGGFAFSAKAGFDAARGIWQLARGEPVAPLHATREFIAGKGISVYEFPTLEEHAFGALKPVSYPSPDFR
jgi:carbamoyl-phosphate synthase large subunit